MSESQFYLTVTDAFILKLDFTVCVGNSCLLSSGSTRCLSPSEMCWQWEPILFSKAVLTSIPTSGNFICSFRVAVPGLYVQGTFPPLHI